MSEKTIKVRGLTSCAGPWGSLSTGEVANLPENIATPLISAGFAERLKAAKKKETATAPEPETPEE